MEGSRYVVVLDFEKALLEIVESKSQVDPTFPCEIIEFPSVLVDLETGRRLSSFRRIVKPKLHPTITPATTKLTSITQKQVDEEGVHFKQAFDAWHMQMQVWQGQYGPLLLATCGDMDMETSFPTQLEYEKKALALARSGDLALSEDEIVHVDDGIAKLKQVGGNRWCNIKEYFKTALGEGYQERLPWYDEAQGIRERLTQASMLAAFELLNEGHHHLGIDDCTNLAELMCRLYQVAQVKPGITKELKEKRLKSLAL
jgi:inhibitor of KinA sporulation pathway (predicted exonuclease)